MFLTCTTCELERIETDDPMMPVGILIALESADLPRFICGLLVLDNALLHGIDGLELYTSSSLLICGCCGVLWKLITSRIFIAYIYYGLHGPQLRTYGHNLYLKIARFY